MAIPTGAVVITGPIVDTSGILPASIVLRDAGAISVYDGRLRRVNAAGDAWDDIPGHHIGTTAPVAASRFLGQIWLDTTDTSALSLKAYNGTDFVEVGGGGGSASVYAFSATLADIADIASGTAFANLTSGLTAGELVNQGSGFTVETAASRDQLVVANAGTYLVMAALIGDADASTLGTARSTLRARIARERSGVITGLAPEGAPTYSRNQYGDFSEHLGSAVSSVYEFEAGDKIEIQGLFEGQGSTVQLDLVRRTLRSLYCGCGRRAERRPGRPGRCRPCRWARRPGRPRR